MAGPDSGEPPAALAGFFEAPTEFSITQTEPEIALLETDGRLRTFHPDGQKYKADAGSSEVKAGWESGRLQVETRDARGTKLSEAYILAPDKRQLVIELRLEGRAGTVTVKRVYDPAPAE